jgi:transglutaminase-like putative cysteine protease/Flp pilus assembly protein TadD
MRSILLICALVLSSHCSFAQSQAAGGAANDPFRNESLVFNRSETTYRMHSDGTGERVLHVLMRIQSQGAAQQFGVLAVGYASANETAHITLVRVHKPDGTSVDTPPDTAIDMPAEVTREAPLYTDLKQKHLAVRSLSVGDTLEYEVHTTIDKPEAPGQFWGATHFVPPGTVVVLAEVVNLEVPKDKYVQVWSPNHKPTVTENDTIRTYSWTVAQLTPAPKPVGPDETTKLEAPKDPDEDADEKKVPSIAWTTFRNWAEVGDWYRAMALPRAEPNEEVRKQANEITRNAKTPEEQVRAIYEFVSSKIRYIGIDFGVGRYQPHAASEVLANQYGDCKDKDTALEALLRASGFVTAPALIGLGIAPVPEVPSPAIFNHVITTVDLPTGRVWLDSTPAVAPYGYLVASIRDQKALVVPSKEPATLVATPAVPPYPLMQRFEATGSLDADGKMTAKMSATYRDDSEILVRTLARSVAPAEWDQASQYISSIKGFGGTTSNSQFKNVEDLSSPIEMTYDYQRHPYGDWDSHRIVPLFPALELPLLSSEATAPKEDIDMGAPRRMVAVTHIELPEHYRTDLPDPVHVRTEFATFDKTYRFDGKEITAERTITVLKEKVAKDEWKSYQKFAKDIGNDSETWIQLIPSSKPIAIQIERPDANKPPVLIARGAKPAIIQSPSATPPETASATDDSSPKELITKAREQFWAGDLATAKAILEAVKQKNPSEEYLWLMLGTIAARQRNYDEAKTDYLTETKHYPDNPMTTAALAEAEKMSGDDLAAQRTLKEYLGRHPDELPLSLRLARMQLEAEDNNSALITLQSAVDQHPDDFSVRLQLSETLMRLQRKDEAAAAAKSVLEDATDPEVMNDAAYDLSVTGRDLAYAETMSRKSVEMLEEKSAGITATEANSKAFASAELLVASWDTLGWILYQEGKIEDARPLIEAAWRNDLGAEEGDHLGQLYEALHKKDEACAAYRLADAAVNRTTTPDVRRHIHDGFARLEAGGAKPGPKNGTESLQNLRTYKLGHIAGMNGWGTFRIELTADGVIEAQQMSGDHRIAGLGDAIKKITFSDLVPPQSKAHLLKSSVVSCSQTAGCEVVLVPSGGLQTEQQ